MSCTRTLFIDLQRLPTDQKTSLVIRLMMACNDIALANQCLSRYKDETSLIRKHVKKGALMYFVRLQCGHLREALNFIEKIEEDDDLSERVNHLTLKARDCYSKLVNCLESKPDHQKFKDYVKKVRDKTVFHYDRKLVEKALTDRASRPESKLSKITIGDDISLWRFELSDDIVDSIICRHIWKIPRSADLRKEADIIADFGSDLCVSFLEFSGEFILSYVKEKAVI